MCTFWSYRTISACERLSIVPYGSAFLFVALLSMRLWEMSNRITSTLETRYVNWRGQSVTMRVYEISEKGERISSASRTKKPRKKGTVFCFKSLQSSRNCRLITMSRPCSVNQDISGPLLNSSINCILFVREILEKGVFFFKFAGEKPWKGVDFCKKNQR